MGFPHCYQSNDSAPVRVAVGSDRISYRRAARRRGAHSPARPRPRRPPPTNQLLDADTTLSGGGETPLRSVEDERSAEVEQRLRRDRGRDGDRQTRCDDRTRADPVAPLTFGHMSGKVQHVRQTQGPPSTPSLLQHISMMSSRLHSGKYTKLSLKHRHPLGDGTEQSRPAQFTRYTPGNSDGTLPTWLSSCSPLLFWPLAIWRSAPRSISSRR